MKFSMVSGAAFTGKISGEPDNVFGWISALDGYHFHINKIRDNFSPLYEFDAVLMVDVSRWADDALRLVSKKSKAKFIFYPEAGDEMYFRQAFEKQKLYCEILKEVDLIGCADEDWIDFYNSLFGNKAFFMHVPMSKSVMTCEYWRDWQSKNDTVLVCCNLGMDENRYVTNLIKCFAAIRRSQVNVYFVGLPEDHAEFLHSFFKIDFGFVSSYMTAPQYVDKYVSRHLCLLNLSDLIGTSRNSIVGASCGTPVIGNIKSHTQRRLFPDLAVDPLNTEKISMLIQKLIKDKEYYAHVCAQAKEKLPYYSTENALRRFNEALKSKEAIQA